MSRFVHFESHVLSALPKIKDRDAVRNALFRMIFDGFEPAFRSLRDLKKKIDDQAVSKREKRLLIENVFSYLALAVRDRFSVVADLMGYDIGFLFQKDTAFKKGRESFLLKYPKIDPAFLDVLEDDRCRWLSPLFDVRNEAIEHSGKIGPEELKRLESYMDLPTAEVMFDNSWRRVEDFLGVFANDIFGEMGGLKLFEIKEYQENRNHPVRFGWFIPTDKLNNQ